MHIDGLKGSVKLEKNELLRSEKEGFSLVELIVVIALMALLVGLAALSVSLLSASDSKGLASHVNDSLTELKSLNESNGGMFFLHIYKKSDGFYAKIDEKGAYGVPTSNEGATRLGSESLKLEATFAAGASSEITGDSNVLLGVRKKDGSFWNPALPTSVVKSFEIKNGDNLEYKVILAEDTGLHYIE